MSLMVLIDSTLSSDVRADISLNGRVLNVALAVERSDAERLGEEGKKQRQDKRNLYLAREGGESLSGLHFSNLVWLVFTHFRFRRVVILPDSQAAQGLSKSDQEKRAAAWRENKAKLNNPNYIVSRTRLSVRNLPLSFSEKDLRSLFVTAVQDYHFKQEMDVKDVKVSLKQVGRNVCCS